MAGLPLRPGCCIVLRGEPKVQARQQGLSTPTDQFTPHFIVSRFPSINRFRYSLSLSLRRFPIPGVTSTATPSLG